jgi:hypothetical protein
MVEKDTTKTINTCRIMGLISQEKVFTEQMKGLYEARTEQHPINVAQVVHATLIVDTVGMLAQTLRKSTQHPPAN